MKSLFYRLKRKKLYVGVFIMVFAFIYLYNYIDKNIRPSLIAIAEVRTRTITTEVINDTIKNKIKEDINYENLILVKYDKDNRVALMQANTILMNSIAADLALEVQDQLKNIKAERVKVPLVNAFNRQLLSLPNINLEIRPQGSIEVGFATEFEEAGINQTRHKIYLIVSSDIRMIVPLVSETIKIVTNIPIAETVILGNVPEQYFTIPSKDYLDIIR